MPKNNKWPESQYSQYGFRKFYSTNDAILSFTRDIQIAFSKNESTVATFLNIKGAYEAVQLNILVNKLEEIGLPNKIRKVIYALYNDLFLHTSDQTIGPRVQFYRR